jgi:aspartate-semialdehyde dehydrogenase
VGQIAAAAEEVSLIQRLEPHSFERIDFVFFAGEAVTTKKHWQDARRAGASIVDLTYALEGERDVLILAPWIAEGFAGSAVEKHLDLNTPAVVPAHPVSVMIGLIAARLRAKFELKSIAATVMEPASEYGRAAMDELHQQTVNLLSFQALPRDQYDAQVAFNLLPELGSAAKVRLKTTELRIRRHYAGITDGLLPQPALQLLQAPVFHGYVVSMLVEIENSATVDQVKGAIAGDHVDVVSGDADAPSNLSAAGQQNILAQVRKDSDAETTGSRFWIWMAADNLKLSALNAIACAAELRKFRPSGKVQ